MSDTESTTTGVRMNPSHLRRVRKEKRKDKGRGVPLDSSLLMGDPSHDPSHSLPKIIPPAYHNDLDLGKPFLEFSKQ